MWISTRVRSLLIEFTKIRKKTKKLRTHNNKFSVSVPGVSTHDVSVSCSGASVSRSGSDWIIKPTGSGNVKVSVHAKIDGTSRLMGSYDYRVVPLSSPAARFEASRDGRVSLSALVNPNNKFTASSSSVEPVHWAITSFQVRLPNGKEYSVKGNSLSNEAIGAIRGLKKGSSITIFNIKASSGAGTRTLYHMKKISVFILVLLASVASNAQHQVNSFFDDMGMVRLETQELKEDSNKIVTVFHRADDVVWSRVVYRIIDMRFKQNYQLYTPVSSDDPVYSSLFRTILRGIEDGMPIYRKSSSTGDIKPYFNVPQVEKVEIPTLLKAQGYDEAIVVDSTEADISKSNYMLLNYDSVADQWTFKAYAYDDFARNTIKYMIQEVIFFDKHYSRLYSKILAIAPMNPDNYKYTDETTVMDALYGQILFWVPFDALRPYMAQQYVTPRGNDNKRITFDDFFIQKMYSSYLVGINNVYNKMIPQVADTYEGMQAEQRRIENELLTAEQDLWAY